MSTAPTDDALVQGFGVEPGLPLEEMEKQIPALAATLGTSLASESGERSRGKVKGQYRKNRKNSSKGKGEQPPASSAPDTPAPSSHTVGTSVSSGKGKGPHPSTKSNKEKLEELTERIQSTNIGNPPPDDIATTTELEAMSVRSSRLEDEIGDLRTQLGVAETRIQSLEADHSSLITHYTNLAKELYTIKEMVSKRAASGNKSSAEVTPTKTPANPVKDGASSGGQVSAPKASVHPVQSSGNIVQSSAVGGGSRIKKKTIK